MAERRFSSLGEDREPSRRQSDEPIAKKRDPGVLGTLLSEFFEEDIRDAIDNVKRDRIVPDVKHMIFNTITDVAGALLGEGRSYSRTSSSIERRSTVGSTSISRSNADRRDRVSDVSDSSSFDSRDYPFDFRGDAEEVLETLRHECAEDGKVSLARFYQMTRNKIDWSDWDIGWRVLDRSNSMCRPNRGKYILVLPKPVSIKNR